MNTDHPPLGPKAPANTRIYAIGDIHGRLDLLNTLLASIAKDSENAPQRKVLVILGDCIDRGAHSAGVVERLSTLHNQSPFDGFELRFIKGNHEQVMLEFLDGENDGQVWLAKGGGMATLNSYGISDTTLNRQELRRRAKACIPKNHRTFMRNMQGLHREGDYAYVHAGVRPNIALTHQDPNDLMWIRRPFLDYEGDFGAVIVHGHTTTDIPDVLPNRIAIDTRAWASGTLSCLVVQGLEQRFLST